MATKEWSDTELDKYGLDSIDFSWGNRQKLETLFNFLEKRAKPLPGVIFQGEIVVSKTELMRMAKIPPRKKVFEPKNNKWASERLQSLVRRFSVALHGQEGSLSEADIIDRLRQQLLHSRQEASDSNSGLDLTTHETETLRQENKRLLAIIEDQQAQLEKQKVSLAEKDAERVRAMSEMLETGRRTLL